jgi:hypothetical protein
MAFRWPQHNIATTTPLDYSADWRRWLNGRTIMSATWSIETESGVVSFEPVTTVDGLTATAKTSTDTVATIYITGGSNNVDYKIYCTIIPSDGAAETRIIRLRTKAS